MLDSIRTRGLRHQATIGRPCRGWGSLVIGPETRTEIVPEGTVITGLSVDGEDA